MMAENAQHKQTREKRQLATTIEAPVIGFVNAMFSVYDFFTNPSTEELLGQIDDIQNQLEGITQDLKDVINQVKDAGMKAQYVSSQRIIVESLRIVTYYLNMTEVQNQNTTQEDIDYWQNEFAKWGSLVRESVSYLMDGMLGRGFISGDIIKTIAGEGNVLI